jgi:soluble lytic murein transglycosylase
LKHDFTALYAEILKDAPDDYYAWMAARRLGKKAVAPTSVPPVDLGRLPADNGIIQLQRFNLLARLDLPDLARRELEGSHNSIPLRTRLDAWIAIGGFHEALRAAYAESHCQPTHPFAAFCFPRAHWTTVQRESQRHSVNPDLVLSLMRQESRFQTDALSPANARGLMQLIPSTAETTARMIGLHDYSLFSPGDNIALGVAYLGELSVRYQGDVLRMLGAYNAGPRAVARWERRFPDAEDDEFIETISYRETRKYVKRVIRNRLIYESMYLPRAPDTRTSD